MVRPGIEPRTSYLRIRCPADCTTRPGRTISIGIELVKAVIPFVKVVGRSGGAVVLGKLPVPEHPTNLDNSRARAYCAYSKRGWVLF